MKVLAFGTYDVGAHPRVQVLIDGLREHGLAVDELNAPLGLRTAERVRMLQQPWRVPQLIGRLVLRWARLVSGSRRFRGPMRPDVVLVGYLGHFDVLLARLLYPRGTIVLDHLIFAANTAADRGTSPGLRTRLLDLLDRLALRAADTIVVDTPEHARLVPPRRHKDTVVVPVGATADWFTARRERQNGPLSLVFFGLFTPLQGAPTIGEALRLLHDRGVSVRATLVGTGQDAPAVRRQLAGAQGVSWIDWVPPRDLPALVASHDVCLGIFGVTEKARRVVPNKVYQGAAAGTAVVTSDTEPQRRALGDAAVLVPPGDAEALAAALEHLAHDPQALDRSREACTRLAALTFTAFAVTAPLVARLAGRPAS